MSEQRAAFDRLAAFLDAAPTPAHAVDALRARLAEAGFRPLPSDKPWSLAPGDACMVDAGSRGLAAFRVPTATPDRFLVAGGHTDSPCLRLRESSTQWLGDRLATATDAYGSIIQSTWLDRPLEVAGSVTWVGPDGILRAALVRFAGFRGVVPNLAIHLNRDINKGYEYNQQSDMRFLCRPAVPDEYRVLPWEWLCREELRAAGHDIRTVQDIVGLDLWLSDAQGTVALDAEAGLFNAPRIDNLSSCLAVADALVDAVPAPNALAVGVFFDHEEIGSRSRFGADSNYLGRLMERIWAVLRPDATVEDWHLTLARSAALSADVAHAQHPNHPECHDPAYAPQLGGGVALKFSPSQRYATPADEAGKLMAALRKRNLPFQRFMVRADLRSGSTIGPSLAALTGMATIDLGIPMLAMHSCRETASMADQLALVRTAEAFYEEF